MAINKLTGTSARLPRPDLSGYEKEAIRHVARQLGGAHVSMFGREYWADPDGVVFVVAWENAQPPHVVSGDPI